MKILTKDPKSPFRKAKNLMRRNCQSKISQNQSVRVVDLALSENTWTESDKTRSRPNNRSGYGHALPVSFP